ncbi:ArsR/SmtB family transcription factor [Salinibacter sp.]|uniref:ArsR/SmtB family transcription factor n=1 Tax=Salinibacter sp. TaxID=2065818 RepID=UPI0021E8F420
MSTDAAAEESNEALESTCGSDASLTEKLPSEEVTARTVRLLKGFADGTRLRILCLLRGHEVCVHNLVEALGMSQSAVSHQLRVLRDARLVSHRREGRHVYYGLADDHVREMLDNAFTHGAEPDSQ